MQALLNRFKDPLVLVLAAFAIIGVMGAWHYAKETPGLDYYVAWVAVDSIENDNKNYVYDPATGYKLPVSYRNKADEAKDAPRLKRIASLKQHMSFTATPFMYWVTARFSVGDYETDLTTWHTLSLLMMVVFFLVAFRLTGYSAATALGLFLPIVFWFVPLYSDLRVGNVNAVQLGMVGLVLWFLGRGEQAKFLFAAGVMVGLVVMFKPNLAPIGLILAGGWLLRGQYSRLVTGVSGMLTGVLAAVLVSSWWIGKTSAWYDWFQMLSGAVGSAPGKGGNYSVMRQLTGGLSPMGQLLLALFLVALALAFFWWGRRRQSRLQEKSGVTAADNQAMEEVMLVAFGCVIALMASALVWIHYYLLTIPLLLVLLRPWAKNDQGSFVRVLIQRILPIGALFLLTDSVIPMFFEQEDGSLWTNAPSVYLLAVFFAGMWQLAYGVARDRPTT